MITHHLANVEGCSVEEDMDESSPDSALKAVHNAQVQPTMSNAELLQRVLQALQALARQRYADTPADKRLSRQPELQQVLTLLRTAVAERQSQTKRLLFIQGEAGIGKSWFLQYFHSQLKELHPEWRVLGIYSARQFVENDPYRAMAQFMDSCADEILEELPAGEITRKQAEDRADLLELRLAQQDDKPLALGDKQPLVLLFDEMEWLFGLEDHRQQCAQDLFKLVWKTLLRRATMPCLIVCVGRRPPIFADILLRQTTVQIPLKGFPIDGRLLQLAAHASANDLQPLVELWAPHGNPWLVRLLDVALAQGWQLLADPAHRQAVQRAIFTAIVSDRVPDDLQDVLYQLAVQRPVGFYDDDQLLPEGNVIVRRLVRTTFVEFVPDSYRYQLAPVLTSLFRGSAFPPTQIQRLVASSENTAAKTANTQPIELFFSYSHKDEELRKELVTHLRILERDGVISSWSDRQLVAGEDWGEQIDARINSAHIILLLVSADFIASDYCWNVEVHRAMARHDAREARVIPVILRPVDWKKAPFSRLQALPRDAKAVTTWPNRDEAFVSIAEGIEAALTQLAR